MAGSDAFNLKILGSILGRRVSMLYYQQSLEVIWGEGCGTAVNNKVAPRKQRRWMTHSCELQDFSSKILENGRNINCCLSSDAHLVLGVLLQETLDTTAGELDSKC